MTYLVVCSVAFVASGLTLFSGFGLGTLLLPAFALCFPVEQAVALTAVVHFLNNLFKLALVGRHADRRAVLWFGVPAIGAALVGLAGAAASSGQSGSGDTIRTAIELGARTGAMVGHLSFSKEQEREADYIAALILYRAGVDLDKARGLLVTMARESGRTQTNMLDSHPVGPERLAAWDRAVAEIRASNGRLPPRAS